MKKLLLITTILLLQSFPSFGNPNGKGILCTIEDEFFKYFDRETKIINKIGFSFSNNKVTQNFFYKKNDEILIGSGDPKDFVTTLTKIKWGSMDDSSELDRKSLKLKDIRKSKLIDEYQCEVFSHKIYFQKFEEMREQRQNWISKKLKNNKI